MTTDHFLNDVQELKSGLIIFHRGDVDHNNWYCRIKVPDTHKYKYKALDTSDVRRARDMAFEADADVRFRKQHNIPIFDKTFEEVAQEYLEYHKQSALAGEITMNRWKVVDSYVRLHLIPYLGTLQITSVSEEKWKAYPRWRRLNSQRNHKPKASEPLKKPLPLAKQQEEKQTPEPAKDGTIRHEMKVLRAIMNFAAKKQYIAERQIPKGKLPIDTGKREEFTLEEWRHLHTFARGWIKEAKTVVSEWYRTVAYNFMLIMANTGMRTMEAGNLRWKDITERVDKKGRPFVCISVHGKGKHRTLVATVAVAEYFNRIKKISKATKPNDFVFTNHEGKKPLRLYNSVMEDLLTKSGLLYSASGNRRSNYCFRHTYATFRLMRNVNVFDLAKQMGTSVAMIEKHYGHITPSENAERILQGIEGWEPLGEVSGEELASLQAGKAGKKPANTRKK